ncbi:uncharacterized protein BP01DRAFT_370171 [Aspergillus saccharolyticus JOP 1030-1]|uniref:Apple domain-containing protein n=1 Tax=Aspergillus saccharolyticus JOP 1030-1 TaxID=1450539 RepID=A0A318ZXC8_9EURO|nr:hypothetical protein BP01DRAFT_370171 [Aspergillus saccharolyticus JOP 1030-1]PYH40122.1 hypothetical protein BP01DRAFT_370171 [Aspergillus saccharolyticus JOP 1030-1]
MLFLVSFILLLQLASLSVSENPGSCISGAGGQGHANYQICCPTAGATGVEMLDTGRFRYTCNAWMSGYDTTSRTAHTAATCARLCLDDEKCRASTWMSSQSRCFLTRTAEAHTNTDEYSTGYLALEKLAGQDLDQACQSRVDAANQAAQESVAAANNACRISVAAANTACETRVDAANRAGQIRVDAANEACRTSVDATVASLQTQIKSCISFTDEIYNQADPTGKTQDDVPLEEFQTVTIEDRTYRVYYHQSTLADAPVYESRDINSLAACLKLCDDAERSGCVRVNYEPGQRKCRLFNGSTNREIYRSHNNHMIWRV